MFHDYNMGDTSELNNILVENNMHVLIDHSTIKPDELDVIKNTKNFENACVQKQIELSSNELGNSNPVLEVKTFKNEPQSISLVSLAAFESPNDGAKISNCKCECTSSELRITPVYSQNINTQHVEHGMVSSDTWSRDRQSTASNNDDRNMKREMGSNTSLISADNKNLGDNLFSNGASPSLNGPFPLDGNARSDPSFEANSLEGKYDSIRADSHDFTTGHSDLASAKTGDKPANEKGELVGAFPCKISPPLETVQPNPAPRKLTPSIIKPLTERPQIIHISSDEKDAPPSKGKKKDQTDDKPSNSLSSGLSTGLNPTKRQGGSLKISHASLSKELLLKSEGVSQADNASKYNVTRRQSALTNLVNCHHYPCGRVALTQNRHSCNLSLSTSYNNNVLKPGIVHRTVKPKNRSNTLQYATTRKEVLISDDKWPSSIKFPGTGRLAISNSPTIVLEKTVCASKVNAENTSKTSDSKRLCKSLSNLTADDVLSAPCGSIYNRTSSIAKLENNEMSNRSKIARLLTSHKRPSSQQVLNKSQEEALRSPKNYKQHKDNIINGLSHKQSTTTTKDQITNKKKTAKESKLMDYTSATDKNNIVSTKSPTITADDANDNENTSGQKSPKSSTARKAPKMPKSLFPFMRRNRKRQNASVGSEQGKPLKAHNNDNLQQSETKFSKRDSGIDSDLLINDVEMKEMACPENETESGEVFGFRKLKVASIQQQRNVHADYATRVARVRRTSASKEKQSILNDNCEANKIEQEQAMETLEQPNTVILRQKNRPRRKPRSRYSADVGSFTHSQNLQNDLASTRPCSMVIGSSQWRHSDVIVHQGVERTSGLTIPEFNLTEPSPQLRIRDFNLDATSSNQQARNRNSLNVDFLRDSHSQDSASFLASLPGPETALGGSKSSILTGISTPCSSLHMRAYSPIHGGARCSFSSSLSSVFDDDCHAVKSRVQWNTGEKNSTQSEGGNIGPRGLLMRRSKSLCRDMIPPKLNLESAIRRTVSPCAREQNSEGIRCDQNNNKRNEYRRRDSSIIQSLKDLSYIKPPQPNKPTTPKPRKISVGGSCNSLNRFHFGMSLQNLHKNGGGSSIQSTNQEPSFDSSEARPKHIRSSKNASIRRRMSLQCIKSVNHESRDGDVKRLSSHGIQVEKDWKRHSLSGLEIENMRFKSSIANNNDATTTTGTRNRRRSRPLSEVQNLRWEVHAIPEHHEIDHPTSLTNSPLHSPPHQSDSPPASSGKHIVFDESSLVVTNEQSNGATHSVQNKWPKCVIGTSFSEENISFMSEEAVALQCSSLHRPLSVIGGINTMPESLMHFYPPKYYSEPFSPTSKYHVTPHMTAYEHAIQGYHCERTRAHGSTFSGISTESGYGTMTRKGTTLRPAEPEDEDVFSYSRGRIGTGFSLSDDCVYVEALWDHVTMDNEELGFKVGDVIRVIDTSNSDWWWGEMDANEGWFPATFVRVLVNQQLCEGSENGDVIASSLDVKHDDTYSIVSHEFTRVTSFSNELCECIDRPTQNTTTCALCGLPIKGLDTENEDKTDPSRRLQPEIVITVPTNPPRKSSITREQIRINVIKEIVSSEKVFVGHLKDVIEGYLARCRKREDMFNEQQIASIFGNIEEIYKFQQGFSEQLCKAMDMSCVPDTMLGNVFLQAKEGFTIYSEYCNNHPQALAQLSQMLTVKKYVRYFEACRLLQKMIDIPLDGFLLTPVQKICKYPLQLAELLKYTSPDHPDYEPVKSALEAMKNVAHMINERKRRMENVKKISMWQSTIINWQGEDVLLKSTELVHSSDIYSISETKNKPKPRIAFLFDHQLILCKKDILRKDLLYYKTRVDLDSCDLVSIENDSPRSSAFADNWSSSSSACSQCGWKFTDRNTGETSVMYCKNANDCMKWMEAFDKANEIAKTRSTSMNEHEMAITQDIIRKQLNSSHEKPNKDAPSRINSTYRYRMKMVHQNGHNEINKSKIIVNPPEKSGGFFSNMTGKLTPFRRSVNSHHQRETNFVF